MLKRHRCCQSRRSSPRQSAPVRPSHRERFQAPRASSRGPRRCCGGTERCEWHRIARPRSQADCDSKMTTLGCAELKVVKGRCGVPSSVVLHGARAPASRKSSPFLHVFLNCLYALASRCTKLVSCWQCKLRCQTLKTATFSAQCVHLLCEALVLGSKRQSTERFTGRTNGQFARTVIVQGAGRSPRQMASRRRI